MHIQINKIEPESERRYVFEAKLGDHIVIGHVTEFDDGQIRGFNFDEDFFDVLFAFNGLGGRFNRDYCAHRNGEGQPFPWDYGDHEPEILARASRQSETEIASLELKSQQSGP